MRGSRGVLGAGVSDTPGPGGSWGPLGEVIRAEHKGGPFFRWVWPGLVSLRSERNKMATDSLYICEHGNETRTIMGVNIGITTTQSNVTKKTIEVSDTKNDTFNQ